MFKTRLISGIVLVILALATIICSGPVLLVTLIGVSCIGMQELYRAAGVHEGKTNGLEIAGYLAVVIYYLTIAYLPVSYHLPAVILGVLVMIQKLRQFPVELRVIFIMIVGLLQFQNRIHQRLRNILSAMYSKSTF